MTAIPRKNDCCRMDKRVVKRGEGRKAKRWRRVGRDVRRIMMIDTDGYYLSRGSDEGVSVVSCEIADYRRSVRTKDSERSGVPTKL